MGEVKKERTGWRDLALSERHRKWGLDCPAVDIDFLLLEYNHSKAVAIIEYKHEAAPVLSPGHPSYKALQDLCDRASLPLFGCRYAADFSWFRVIPGNSIARLTLERVSNFTEAEYVSFLLKLRGFTPTP